MTEREDIPSKGLVTEPSGDQGWEWVEPPYDAPARPVNPPAPPWYRRQGVLIGLIMAAMVALVIASVMLLTSARFGETDDVRLRPTIQTSAVSVPAGPQRSAAVVPESETPTEPTPSTSPSKEPGPVGETEPQAPAPSSHAPAGGPGQAPGTPEGPRTNVTRNPMSFNPRGH